MAEFIEILSPSALKDLETLNKGLLETIKRVDQVGQSMGNITTPSASGGALKDLTAEYKKQEQIIQQLQAKLNSLNNTEKNIQKTRLEEIRLQKAREKAFDDYDKKMAREQQKLQASENLYNKVQSKLNALSNEYKALAVRKELSGKLTDVESRRYEFLQKRIQTYDQTLKAVDATMGKYQRNVGNYASAFNPLQNSINQLTREMPAFTYSVQTGFMAISNNLPLFFDAISQTRNEIAQLKAQGQEVPSLFKQLTSSLLSWGTALSVGITLLTVFGKEIGDAFKNAFTASKQLNALTESQKAFNEIGVQSRKNIAEEVVSLKSLLAIAKDTSLSYRERMIAVKELQSTYPAYFGNLETSKILAGEVAQAETALTNAILSRAKAQAATAKITENQSKIIDLEEKRLKLLKDLERQTAVNERVQNQAAQTLATSTKDSEFTILRAQTESSKLNTIKNELARTDKEIASITDLNNRLTSYAIENDKKAILLKEKDVKTTEAQTKATKDKNKEKEKERELIVGSVEWLQKEISLLEQQRDQLSTTTEQYQEFTKEIDVLKKTLELLLGTQKKVNEEGIELDLENDLEETIEGFRNFEKEMRLRAQGAVDAWASENGFPTMFKILQGQLEGFGNNWYDTTQGIIGATQEMFAFINAFSQENFDAQFRRLEQEKEVALLFAGESADARERIEEQYEARRRAIQRRQAEAQKRLAIFSIITDTAKGVVAALGTLNVPLSVIIGALGLARLAQVQSQQIPEFWKGTDNAPEGWAWTQEKGREIITDAKGKIKSVGSDGGRKLTYLSKGDKVYTNEETRNFERNLNSMLIGQQIEMPKQSYFGLTKDDLRVEVDRLLQKDSVFINVDKNGLNTFVQNGNTRKILLNNHLRLQGRNV